MIQGDSVQYQEENCFSRESASLPSLRITGRSSLQMPTLSDVGTLSKEEQESFLDAPKNALFLTLGRHELLSRKQERELAQQIVTNQAVCLEHALQLPSMLMSFAHPPLRILNGAQQLEAKKEVLLDLYHKNMVSKKEHQEGRISEADYHSRLKNNSEWLRSVLSDIGEKSKQNPYRNSSINTKGLEFEKIAIAEKIFVQAVENVFLPVSEMLRDVPLSREELIEIRSRIQESGLRGVSRSDRSALESRLSPRQLDVLLSPTEFEGVSTKSSCSRFSDAIKTGEGFSQRFGMTLETLLSHLRGQNPEDNIAESVSNCPKPTDPSDAEALCRIRHAIKEIECREAMPFSLFLKVGKQFFESQKLWTDGADVLASKNYRLVLREANNFLRPPFLLEDLIMIGNQGLVSATHRFNPSANKRFSTFATWWIRQALTRSVHKEASLIHVPEAVRRDAKKIEKEKDLIGASQDWRVDNALLIKKLKFSNQRWKNAQRASQSVSSIDQAIEENVKTQELDVPTRVALQERSELVKEILGQLPMREQITIVHRFGLYGEPELTFSEIGKILGVSRQQAGIIATEAIQTFRRLSDRRGLSIDLSSPVDE